MGGHCDDLLLLSTFDTNNVRLYELRLCGVGCHGDMWDFELVHLCKETL